MIQCRNLCGLINISFLLFIAAGMAAAQSAPVRRRDTQNWNDVQLAIPMTKQVDFVLIGHLRMGDNLSRPVDERVGAGFSFALGKFVTLFPNYLHINMQPAGGVHSSEHRISFAATVRVPLGKFTLSDRNTFEHRYRDPQVNATRYRNRMQVDHPVGPERARLTLFANDEVFHDWSVHAWVRNRFSVGLSHKFSAHFTGEVYYLRQNDHFTNPGDLHVLGTTMRFHL